ncbi:armadillo-type protein [Limtongia smithiae]|uniref:armadillo-type protein n=1 Tax=Limtongia smithiae TaxID=1125753 RepID=UPI0034CE0ABE
MSSTSQTAPYSVASLLDKLSSQDSDYRFMSLSDLYKILDNKAAVISHEPNSQTNRIVNCILRSLADNNAEVQNLAVKCLSPLVRRTNENQLSAIIVQLSKTDSEIDDSLASTALRTVITSVPVSGSTGRLFITRLLPILLPQLRTSTDKIDVLVDLIHVFGSSFTQEQVHETQNALIGVLASGKGLVRKRAVGALGALSNHLQQKLWIAMMEYLQTSFADNKASTDKLRILVSVTGTLCSAEQVRIGPFLSKLVPPVITALEVDDDDLREAVLKTLDTFIELCPKELAPFTSDVITVASRFVRYDPNYAADDEDEEDEDGQMMDTDDENDEDNDLDDEYEEDEFSDDEDVSWKLRRSAAKLVATLIETRRDMLPQLYTSLASVLISRFTDREETVRTEVMHTFAVLAEQTDKYKDSTSTRRKRRMSDDSMLLETDPRVQLSDLSGKVFKILAKHLAKTSGLETKQASLTVATELVTVLTTLPAEFSSLVPTIVPAFNQGTLRISIITFINTLVTNHGLDEIINYLPSLVSVVIAGVDDKFYKVSSESLMTAENIVRLITEQSSTPADTAKYVRQLHDLAVAKAIDSEADLVVRESSILVIARVMVSSKPVLQPTDYQSDALIFWERLRNETTRLIAIKAIDIISLCPAIDVSWFSNIWVTNIITELAGLLRKADRSLRAASINGLKTFTEKFGIMIDTATVSGLLLVLRGVLLEDNLQLIAPTMHILTILVAKIPHSQVDILDCVIQLLPKSASTTITESFILFFSALAQQGQSSGLFDSLSKEDLLVPTGAKVLAAVVVHGGLIAEKVPLIKAIAEKSGESDVAAVRGSLMVLGEIAKIAGNDFPTDIVSTKLLFDKFTSANDDVRVTAAQTLGAIAASNVSSYVSLIISHLGTDTSKAYLLVISLREVIVYNSVDDAHAALLSPYVKDLWLQLFAVDYKSTSSANTANEAGGLRAVASECIARLAMIDPIEFIPDLSQRLRSGDAVARNIVITAVRFLFNQPREATSGGADAVAIEDSTSTDEVLTPLVEDFFALLQDSDLENRRLAISAVASIAHNKPQLLAEYLARVLPLLFADTFPRAEYIREVQMGPFKHKIDDALDVRKAAYETIYALLVAFAGQKVVQVDDRDLQLENVFDRAMAGLDDDHDVKVVSCVTIGKISETNTGVVAAKLDVIASKFTDLLNTKPKETAIKQEFERHSEIIRRVLRTTQEIQAALTSAESKGKTYPSGGSSDAKWVKYMVSVVPIAKNSTGSGR